MFNNIFLFFQFYLNLLFLLLLLLFFGFFLLFFLYDDGENLYIFKGGGWLGEGRKIYIFHFFFFL